MTTFSWSLTGRESLLSILGKNLKKLSFVTKAFLLVMFRFLLTVAGLAFICLSAFAVATALGYLVTGFSLLVLEWVVKRQ